MATRRTRKHGGSKERKERKEGGERKERKEGGKRKTKKKGASDWTNKVMAIYRDMKKKDASVKLGAAMKEASRLKKAGKL